MTRAPKLYLEKPVCSESELQACQRQAVKWFAKSKISFGEIGQRRFRHCSMPMVCASNPNLGKLRFCRNFLLQLLLAVELGCSSPNVTAPAQTGGNAEIGGEVSLGGGTLGGSSSNTGGSRSTSSSSSGEQATGGTTSGNSTTSVVATGGHLSSDGGNSATGGNHTGGVPAATGGAQGSGGRVASGGSASTGGAPETGGKTMSGGAAPTGGVSATGGKSTTQSGGSMSGGASSQAQHWVGTWSASPYYDSGNQPPSSLSNSVLRQVVHVSLGGSQIRVQFSNLSGNGPVTINAAHVALCKSTSAADSTIDTGSDKALAFSGNASVTVAQGKEVWSDSVDFQVPALSNVTITTAFGSVPSNVVGHSGSRTTSYLQTGSSNVNAASMTSAQTTEHWYYIAGIDVMADASSKAAAAIGDSITDGRGTDTNKNNRRTDVLAARLQASPSTSNVAILNQGIGATNLVGSSGTAAQARFNRDVLGQSGVRYAIVYDGVNDIGGGASFSSMKAAYDDLISRAHAKGLLIYGGTILPFGGNSYYSAAHESVRQQVNTYIKSGAFDGYIDFDAALTDNGNPPKLQTTYAQWAQADGLHPGPAGYQKMGSSVELGLFSK